MVSRSQLPHLAVVLFGVVLLGVAVPQVLQGEYTHEVDSATAAEYRTADTETESPFVHAYRYENLSVATQDAFERAVDSENDESTVRAANRAPEFRYGDVIEQYYVQYQSEYYVLTTAGPGFLGRIPDIAFGLVGAFGLLAVLAGGVDFWRQRHTAVPERESEE